MRLYPFEDIMTGNMVVPSLSTLDAIFNAASSGVSGRDGMPSKNGFDEKHHVSGVSKKHHIRLLGFHRINSPVMSKIILFVFRDPSSEK